MISTELAVALREAGLVWHPRSGDRFQLDEPEFDADVFTVSEMTIEPRDYPTGRILSFNGTTEWALDSVALEDALWLPHESQLRELLRGAFRSLRRLDDTHEVSIVLRRAQQPAGDDLQAERPADVDADRPADGHAAGGNDETLVFEHPEPADAYALAVLEMLRRIA